MRYLVYVVGVVGLLTFAALAGALTGVCAQTAQESIERTIGSLVVQNANCSAQGLAQAEELRKVKAELAELKAKAEPVK